nr:unnamed protein product [Digitaria exilis]
MTSTASRTPSPPPRCTSLVATLGFVWSCHHRAKEATPDEHHHTRGEHGRRQPDLLGLLHRPPLADEPSAPRQRSPWCYYSWSGTRGRRRRASKVGKKQ